MSIFNRNIAVMSLAITLTASLLSGCGFHLRGEQSLPAGFERVYVTGPLEVTTELGALLDSGGAKLTKTATDTDAAVYLSSELINRRVLSVDPNTGKEREIELVYSVSFRVTKGSGDSLLGLQTVRLRRDYIFDANAVLGSGYEVTVLYGEMRRDAAEQIMRRLGNALKS